MLYSQTTNMRSPYQLPLISVLNGISSDTIGFSNFSCSGISFSVRLYSINKRVIPAAAAFASPSLPNAVADSFKFISLRNFSNILSFFVSMMLTFIFILHFFAHHLINRHFLIFSSTQTTY